MAITFPLNGIASSQADDVFFCRHPEMAPGGQRQPLHATSSEHANMREEWVLLYEDILAHNEDGSRPFPACAASDHTHHSPDCPHCSEPEEPGVPKVLPEDPPAGPDPPAPDPNPVEPVIPCDSARLTVKVTDEDEFPIEGADTYAGELGTKVTDANGIANYGEVSPGTYHIAATKPGHAPARNDPEGYDDAPDTAVPANQTTVVELIQHPLCANVAIFDGTPNGRTKFCGFDPKTDLPSSSSGNYWKPVPDHGAISMGSRTKRDGARWVSVAAGHEAEVEIEFDFKTTECIPCIENCTFEISPGSIAEVVTKKISAKKAVFKIKGKAPGEASLKVFCDGNEIGWFHIWCRYWKKLKIDVACIVTSRTSSVAYNATAIKNLCNRIFRQAIINFSVRDLGVIDMSSDVWLGIKERTAYDWAGTKFTSSASALGWLHTAASSYLAARTSAPFARSAAYRIYFYVPPDVDAGGSVINIGSSPAFVFFGPGASANNSAAHELGHSLGLNHPAHDGTAGQFPAHLLSGLNTAIAAQSATSTEIAVTSRAAHFNIMAKDAHNLMGYWSPKPDRKMLRYNQWKSVKRR